MKIYGIAGGIGSGKSYVTNILTSMGFPCFNSDIEAKLLYLEQEDLIHIMKNRYGNDIYLYDDEGRISAINSKKLSNIIFSNIKELGFINSEIHPRLREKFQLWLKERKEEGYKISFIESALIFNSGLKELINEIILVSADLEIRISRAINRDKCSREEILSRINKQKSQEEMTLLSDHIIYNDEKHLIIPQLLEIINLSPKK